MTRLANISAGMGRQVPPATTIHQTVAFEGSSREPQQRRMGRGSPAQVAEDLSAYEALGIRSVVCNFIGGSTHEVRRAMETFARRVMPQF